MKTPIKFLICSIFSVSTSICSATPFTAVGTFYMNKDNPVGTAINELTTAWGYPDGGATGSTPPYYYPTQGAPYATLPNGTQYYAYPPVTSPGLSPGWQYSPDLQLYKVPSTAKAVLLTIKVKAKALNVAPYDRSNMGEIQLSVTSPTNTQTSNEVVIAHAEKPSSPTTAHGQSTVAQDINTISIPVGVSMVDGKLVFKLYTSAVGTVNATMNRKIYITGYWQ